MMNLSYSHPSKFAHWLDQVSLAFENKVILLTGASGFLGQVFLQKLWRLSPTFSKIYALQRPHVGINVKSRLYQQILVSPLFSSLVQGQEAQFQAQLEARLEVIEFDLNLPDLGLSECCRLLLSNQVHIAIHLAANPDWNAPIDESFQQHVFAPLQLLEFLQSMPNLHIFLHISSGYITTSPACSTSLLKEEHCPLNQNNTRLINEMMKRPYPTWKSRLNSLSKPYLNSHIFTKTVGDHFLILNRGNLPMIIIRPVLLGPVCHDPLPGWMPENCKLVPFLVLEGRDQFQKEIPFRKNNLIHCGSHLDIIPCDYVANLILISITQHSIETETKKSEDGRLFIYNASSSPNILCWRLGWRTIEKYWFKLHSIDRIEDNINTFDSDQLQHDQDPTLHLKSNLEINSTDTSKSKLSSHQCLTKLLYQWSLLQLFFKPIERSTTRIDQLRHLFDPSTLPLVPLLSTPVFNPLEFDTRTIDWHRYLLWSSWGVSYFLLHQIKALIPSSHQLYCHLPLSINLDGRYPIHLSYYNQPWWRGNEFETWFDDLKFSYTSSRSIQYPSLLLQCQLDDLILSSPSVQFIINHISTKDSIPINVLKYQSKSILKRMTSRQEKMYISLLSWPFRKLARKLYQSIDLNENVILQMKTYQESGKTIIIVPSHRSYIDFLVVTYVLFAYHLRVPMIAAGEDFLNISLISSLLRSCGTFFIRRSFREDPLYQCLFKEYIRHLVLMQYPIEFFIEGTRSRSGKSLPPKLGMIQIINQSYWDEMDDKKDVVYFPVSINYDRILEDHTFTREWMGERKKPENLKNLISGMAFILNEKLGRISLQFGDPVSLLSITKSYIYHKYNLEYYPVKKNEIEMDLNEMEMKYKRILEKRDQKELTHFIADLLIKRIEKNTMWTPTSIVGSIILDKNLSGISLCQLLVQTRWMIKEIIKRKIGHIDWICIETSFFETIQNALTVLKDGLSPMIITELHPTSNQRIKISNDQNQALLIHFYQNQMIHLFVHDAYLSSSIWSLIHQNTINKIQRYRENQKSSDEWITRVKKGDLKDKFEFLKKWIGYEFMASNGLNIPGSSSVQSRIEWIVEDEFDKVLNVHLERGWLIIVQDQSGQDFVQISTQWVQNNQILIKNKDLILSNELILNRDQNSNKDQNSSQNQIINLDKIEIDSFEPLIFFSNLIQPVIDSYWAMVLIVTHLDPKRMKKINFFQEVINLLDQFLERKKLRHLYSLSRPLLMSTFQAMIEYNVIKVEGAEELVSLGNEYQKENEIFELLVQFTSFRIQRESYNSSQYIQPREIAIQDLRGIKIGCSSKL